MMIGQTCVLKYTVAIAALDPDIIPPMEASFDAMPVAVPVEGGSVMVDPLEPVDAPVPAPVSLPELPDPEGEPVPAPELSDPEGAPLPPPPEPEPLFIGSLPALVEQPTRAVASAIDPSTENLIRKSQATITSTIQKARIHKYVVNGSTVNPFVGR
jgi:hypothetical protein